MIKKLQFRKSFAVVLAAITVILAPTSVQAAKVRLSIEGCILSKGDKIDIDVNNKKESSGIYCSSDKRIATVSKNGIVKAKKAGAVQISWTKGKKKYVCNIIVGKAPTISKTKITVKEGKSKKVSISKFGNLGLKAVWSSENPDIAIVKKGKITGVSEGTATINVTIKGYTKNYKKTIIVTVVKNDSSDSLDTNLPNQDSSEKLPGTENSDTTGNDSTTEKEPIIEIVTGSGVDTEDNSGVNIKPVTDGAVTTGSSVITGDSIVTGGSVIVDTENNGNSETNNPVDGTTGNENITHPTTEGSIIIDGTDSSNKEEQNPIIPDNSGSGNDSTIGNENESSSTPVTGGSVDTNGTESSNPEIPDSSSKPDTSVKSMAEQVVELVNKERTARGLSELILDIKLTACADIRAEELMDTFAHIRPDGTSCFTVLDENNVNYMACAENIAMGQKTAESVMNSWMNSTGHKNNILNSRYNKIGIGYFQLGGTSYWVQLFTD